MVHWWVGGCCWSMGCKIPFSGQLWMKSCCFHWLIAWGSLILPPWRRLCPNSLILEDWGVGCCLPGFFFTWNPIGKENKHRKQRVCCPLQSHPFSSKIGGSSEHFFFAAKLLIIIILASPAALEQWGHVTKYLHQVLLARVGSCGRGDLHWSLLPLPPRLPPIKEEQHVCFGIYIGSCVTKIWYTHLV